MHHILTFLAFILHLSVYVHSKALIWSVSKDSLPSEPTLTVWMHLARPL